MDILLGTLFLIICILLIIVVLLQRGRGGGLGAAFGGAGSSAFGTRTGDVFTWVTIVLTALFLLLAIGASFAFRPEVRPLPKPEFRPEPAAITAPSEVEIFVPKQRRAEIYYTIDGAEPTRDSRRYSIPVLLDPGTVLKARAFLKGWADSEITTGEYARAVPQAAAPLFDPPSREISGAIEVALSCATEGAVIRYTVGGADPTEQALEYRIPLIVEPGTTLTARAFHADYKPSEVAVAAYLKAAVMAPRPAPPGGEIAGPVKVAVSCATPDATVRYTLDGTDPTEQSAAYEAPVTVEPGTTLKLRGFRADYEASPVVEARYDAPAPPTRPATAPAPAEVTE